MFTRLKSRAGTDRTGIDVDADRRLIDHTTAQLRRTAVRLAAEPARRQVVCGLASVLDTIAQHMPQVHDEVRQRAVEVCQELDRER